MSPLDERAGFGGEPGRWKGLDPATIAIAAGRGPEGPEGAGHPVNVPPVLSSVYKAGSEHHYARSGNPTWSAFEEVIGALEGGRAVSFSSGTAATAALLDTLPLGSKVVISEDSYYGTRKLLGDLQERGMLTFTTADVTDPEAVIGECEGASLLWLESPTNPRLAIADIRALTGAAHERGIRVVADNTFATPLLQRPLELGADVVLHSVSKFISGHSDVVMGVIVTADEELALQIYDIRTSTGGIPGPLETFLALRGVRSLPVRLEKAQINAGALAERLLGHPAVEQVLYPGLPSHPGHELAKEQMTGPGAIVSFVVAGGADAADAVCDTVHLILHATSLGGIETSIERRARWAGEESTPPALLRMSVGCEALEDLWADLDKALRAV